jgi:hypothetical protein
MRPQTAKDPSRTYQSLLILAAFRPWGGSQDSYRARGLATQSIHLLVFACPSLTAEGEVMPAEGEAVVAAFGVSPSYPPLR